MGQISLSTCLRMIKVTNFNRWSVLELFKVRCSSSCPQSETLNIKSRKRITWVPGRLLVSDAISPILRRAKNAKLNAKEKRAASYVEVQMERNDVIKRFNKSSEIGTRTSGWDGLFRFKPSIIFPTTKTCVLSGKLCNLWKWFNPEI